MGRPENGHTMHIRAMTSLDIPGSIELWQVALSEERLSGAVLAGHDGRRGFLYHLAVHPDFRARGLGRALAERATWGLREMGVLKCHVMVFRNNDHGGKFWSHLAWRRRDDINVHSFVKDI